MTGLRTAVILVLGLLLAAGAAQAQTEVNLVSNTGQESLDTTNFTRDAAQAFTTGNHADGYQLKKVVMFARSTSGQPTYTAALHANTRLNNQDRPGTRLGTLSNPALPVGGTLGQLNLTTAGITLDANTTYWVVIDASSGTADHTLGTTFSKNEDPGAAAGWSISNRRLTRLNDSDEWGGTATVVYRIAVHGHARTVTTVKLMSNTGQGQTSDTSFLNDYAQKFETGTHAPGYQLESVALRVWKHVGAAEPDYTVSIHANTTNLSGNDWPATTSLGMLTPQVSLSTTANSEVEFATSGISLDAETTYWVVVDVSTGTASQRLGRTDSDNEDADTAPGWNVAAGSLQRGFNISGWTTPQDKSLRIAMHGYAKAPTVSHAVVSGARLMLTFNEPLDSDATPAASAFSVTVASADRTVNAVVVSGSTVTLTLASAVTAGQTVTVGYTAPTSGSTLQLPSALGGTTVATFSAQTATNLTGTPDISGVALVSTPSRDTDGTPDTYVLTDRIEVQVTFDEAVTVDTTSGTPRLKIKFDPRFGENWADYTSGSGTTALTFAYTVVAGNFSSRGVAVLVDTLELNSGTIKATAAGQAVAILNHPGLAHDPAHKVDANRLPASLVSNAEQAGTGTRNFAQDYAMQFTTGSHPFGYRLERVSMYVGATSDPTYTVSIHANNPAEQPPAGRPATTSLATLTNPAALPASLAPVQFTTSGIDLDPDTKYWLVLDVSSGDSTQTVGVVGSDDEDAGSEPGWSMGNDIVLRNNGDSGWAVAPLTVSLRMAVHGQAKAPTVSSAVADGTRLVLTFNAPLGQGATPAASAFTVTVGGTTHTVNTVTLSGFTVTLTLATAVTTGQIVDISYTPPTANPLQGSHDNAVASFTRTVTNATGIPDIRGVALASTPSIDTDTDGRADTYALTEQIEVQVTFDEAVAVTGTPRLQIKLAPTSGERWADYASGSGGTALTFAYTVATGDRSSSGVAVTGDTLQLNSGTITATATGNATAVLHHAGLAHDPAHKVDATRTPPDTIPPELQRAAVNGTTLTLTYDEALDTGSMPAASAFSVMEGGLAVGLAATTPVAISGMTVTLNLAGAVEAGRTVEVSYTAPTANPLQDIDGNDAASFSRDVDANNTPASSLPSTPAGALVSNVGRDNVTARVTFNTDLALAFTTGAHAGGYTLSRVDIQAQHVSTTAPNYAVEIWEADVATPPLLGTRRGTLENPVTLPTASNALATFTAPPGLALTADTTYFVVLDVGTASTDTRLPLTASDDEDTGAAAGWSIADTSRQRTSGDTGNGSTSWTEVAGAAVWKIAVHGTTRSSLGRQSATVNGTTLTLTFDGALKGTSVPAASAFGVIVNGATRSASTVTVNATTVTLTLASAVTAGQTVTVRYTVPPTNPLQDSAGHAVASFGAQSVTNTTSSGGSGGGGGNQGGGGGSGSRPRDDHGNSASSATPIAPSGHTDGQLHTTRDVDYFTLTAPYAGVLVVETTGRTDTQGTVWQDDVELATADSGGTRQNFRLSVRVAAGEPVVLAVRGNGRQTGPYVLQTALVMGYLENPGPASFQSGIGVISGWVCAAEGVEIEIVQEDGPVHRLEAAYGTERADTAALPDGMELCGDMDNGFGLLFNWNLLEDGEHEVIALVNGVAVGRSTVDGIELGRATVTVTTLGAGFLRGAEGACVVDDFPTAGETVPLAWQQNQQNFVIAGERAPSGASRAGTPGVGYLEVPGGNSFQSGIGVISGWVCAAETVEIVFETEQGGVHRLEAAYGTERADTAALPDGTAVCGDRDNGFGLLFNWNLLGAGEHAVVAEVDGAELGRAVVQVTLVDEAEPFVRGLVGECVVEDFPTEGETVTLKWQQGLQNFAITGVD